MQSREERHLRRVAESLLAALHFTCRFLHLTRIGIGQLLQNREMPDRFIELEIFARLHRFRADFPEALEIG